MTRDEIKSIRENLRDVLDELDKLDELEEWDSIHERLAIDSLLDFIDYARRQKEYYTMYRRLSDERLGIYDERH